MVEVMDETKTGEEGGALGRIAEKIAQARRLPDTEPYIRQGEDPLVRLQELISGGKGNGVEDSGADRPSGSPSVGSPSQQEPRTGGRFVALGRALEATLNKKPLPGEVRAEVASRLAALLDGPRSQEVEAIWELVVFGRNDPKGD